MIIYFKFRRFDKNRNFLADLSLEVTRQGHFDLVTPIIDSCVYMCKTEGVCKWIENKGGLVYTKKTFIYVVLNFVFALKN